MRTNKSIQQQKERIGMVGVSKHNERIVIVKYDDNAHLWVKFDDGFVLGPRRYEQFCKGLISRIPKNINLKDKRVGEKGKSTDGQSIEIVRYENHRKIWVKFPNGDIVGPHRYNNFVTGSIAPVGWDKHNKFRKKERIGETVVANNGMAMTVIDYQNRNNVSVRFSDGTIVNKVVYRKFKKGEVSNPNIPCVYQTSFNEFMVGYYLERIGFVKKSQEYYKSIGLGNKEFDLYNEKIKVAIEYDGERFHQNVARDLAKDLRARELGITIIRIREKGLPCYESCAVKFQLQNNEKGNKYLIDVIKKINAWVSDRYKDVGDIKFSDNDKQHILEGFYKYKLKYADRVGEKVVTTKGLVAKIVKYYNSENIFVEFNDDGQLHGPYQYKHFKKGKIGHG